MALDPAALLAGPRGRRLCLEFARMGWPGRNEAAEEFGIAAFYAAYALDPGRGTSVVILRSGAEQDAVPEPPPADVARLLAEVPLAEATAPALLEALMATVDAARYWQEPGGEDVLAAAPELQEPLARVARHVLGSPNAAWWSSPMDDGDQWATTFTDTVAPEPETDASSGEILAAWLDAQKKEERIAERDRPAEPDASWSGTWWSKPPERLSNSTRSLAGRGPARLSLVEDSLGWRAASVEPIAVPADARVYEIDSAAAWAELCRRYPLEVTASRRHDWYRATGRAGRWVIPDWSRVQPDLDAVHLTVGGYLSSAGLAIPVDGERASVLAGWDPDQTWWLREVTHVRSRREAWTREHRVWARA